MHDCIGFCNHNENETQVNEYVTTFIETMQENIKDLGILYLPPTKYPTPYGGQLIWNLPGKTYLIVHLKDKNKIRHRKRWSQVYLITLVTIKKYKKKLYFLKSNFLCNFYM